jgi:Rrf2 family protein
MEASFHWLLTLPFSCNIYSYMKRNGRLSDVLHVLLHMAEERGPIKSEMLAKALGTNPVVIRRVMAGLRDQGYVQSEKGHGGGWTLACSLRDITLRDIYAALGCPPLLAICHRTESPGCLVEQAVNAALNQAFHDAEALLLSRLGEVTLAMLSVDFHNRLGARGGLPELENLETVHASAEVAS